MRTHSFFFTQFCRTVVAVFSYFFLSLCTATTPVHAQEILFSDDFSTGFTKWQPTRDNGSMWKVVDGKAEVNVNRSFTITEMIPKDEYWNSEWKDIEYELDFTPLQGVDRNISFGFQDIRNWYEIHFVSTFYNLVRLRNGIATLNVFSPYILENNKTYRLKIRLQSGNIKIFIDGVTIADYDDWSFDHNYGRIGLKAGTGSSYPTQAQFDNIVVRSVPPLDGVQLKVPLFKQGDAQWKDAEYDHATKWSDRPTIKRWGCALSSAAMILRYHNIQLLPDGQLITPFTLNNWLRSQSDGYIGEGAVNWQAITRLTRLISEKSGTPKLEYTRVPGSFETAKNEILAMKPVIVEIAGHFLVGSGVTGNGADLYIKDPAYTYTTFSQHKTDLLSVRKFQPSFTDLSYLLFTHAPDVHITVKDAMGNVVTNLEKFTEQITDHSEGSGEKTTLLGVTQIAKPVTGRFTIEITKTKPGPYSIQVLAYDVAANVTTLPLTGLAGTTPVKFTLQYQKTGTSQLHRDVSFAQVRVDLTVAKSLRLFTHEYGFTQLNQLLQIAENSSSSRQARYIQQVAALLTQYRKHQTPDLYVSLQTSVTLLKQKLGVR